MYGPAHLLDSRSSKWDRARSLDKQLKAMIARAVLNSLTPHSLKKESRYIIINNVHSNSEFSVV